MDKLQGFAPVARACLIFAVGSFLILAGSDLLKSGGGLRISSDAIIGRDFVNVWAAGKLVWAHNFPLIYDIDGYRDFLYKLLNINDIYAYSYPPATLFLAAMFGALPYSAALAVWTLAGAGLFYLAARRYFVDAGLPPVLALFNPAGFVCLWAGHYGLLVGALALAGWRWLDDRPRLAGLMFGLMTIKPHLGILVALVLVLQRKWLAAAFAALTFMAIFVVSGLAFGFNLWMIYLGHTLSFHAELLTRGVASFHSMMPTVTATMMRLNAPSPLVEIMQVVSAAFAVSVAALACRRNLETIDIGLIASTAIFLVLPYAFNYDMTMVSAGIVIFAAKRGYYYSLGDRIALIAGFMLPLLLGPGRTYMVLGPAVLIFLLLVQLKIATATARLTARRAAPAGAGEARSA